MIYDHESANTATAIAAIAGAILLGIGTGSWCVGLGSFAMAVAINGNMESLVNQSIASSARMRDALLEAMQSR